MNWLKNSHARTMWLAGHGLTFALLLSYGCSSGGGNSGTTPTTPPAQTRSYGASLPTKQEVDNRVQAITPFGAGAGASLPASIDYSTDPSMPIPGDQGAQSSCVAWAAGYDMMTFMIGKAKGMDASAPNNQGSPSDLYTKVLQVSNRPCNSYTDPATAMDVLVKYGVANMSQSPYISSGCAAPSSSGAFGITGYHTLQPANATAIKRQLASGNVLPFVAKVYDDLQYWGFYGDRRGVYHGSGNLMPNVGHAMTLVGYQADKGGGRAGIGG